MRTHTHHSSTPPAVPTIRGKRSPFRHARYLPLRFPIVTAINTRSGRSSSNNKNVPPTKAASGSAARAAPCLQEEGFSASRRQPCESGCVSRWAGRADRQRAFCAAATASCRCFLRGTTPDITILSKQPRRKPRSCGEAPQRQACASWALECGEAAR